MVQGGGMLMATANGAVPESDIARQTLENIRARTENVLMSELAPWRGKGGTTSTSLNEVDRAIRGLRNLKMALSHAPASQIASLGDRLEDLTTDGMKHLRRLRQVKSNGPAQDAMGRPLLLEAARRIDQENMRLAREAAQPMPQGRSRIPQTGGARTTDTGGGGTATGHSMLPQSPMEVATTAVQSAALATNELEAVFLMDRQEEIEREKIRLIFYKKLAEQFETWFKGMSQVANSGGAGGLIDPETGRPVKGKYSAWGAAKLLGGTGAMMGELFGDQLGLDPDTAALMFGGAGAAAPYLGKGVHAALKTKMGRRVGMAAAIGGLGYGAYEYGGDAWKKGTSYLHEHVGHPANNLLHDAQNMGKNKLHEFGAFLSKTKSSLAAEVGTEAQKAMAMAADKAQKGMEWGRGALKDIHDATDHGKNKLVTGGEALISDYSGMAKTLAEGMMIATGPVGLAAATLMHHSSEALDLAKQTLAGLNSLFDELGNWVDKITKEVRSNIPGGVSSGAALGGQPRGAAQGYTGVPSPPDGTNPGAPGEPGGTGAATKVDLTPIAAGDARSATAGDVNGERLSGGQVAGRVQEAYDFYRSKGWSHEASVGLVANQKWESGMSPTKYNPNDPGGSHGYSQWNRERLDGLKSFAKANGLDWTSRQAQLEYTHFELTQGGSKAAGDALKGAKTSAEATAVVNDKYEVSGDRQSDPNLSHRQGERSQVEQIVAMPRPGALGGPTAGPVVGRHPSLQADTTPVTGTPGGPPTATVTPGTDTAKPLPTPPTADQAPAVDETTGGVSLGQANASGVGIKLTLNNTPILCPDPTLYDNMQMAEVA